MLRRIANCFRCKASRKVVCCSTLGFLGRFFVSGNHRSITMVSENPLLQNADSEIDNTPSKQPRPKSPPVEDQQPKAKHAKFESPLAEVKTLHAEPVEVKIPPKSDDDISAQSQKTKAQPIAVEPPNITHPEASHKMPSQPQTQASAPVNKPNEKPEEIRLTPKEEPPKAEPTIEEKLQSFGYKFIDGELRDIKTNGKFEFNVYENHRDNQNRYEALGNVINQYVYYLLETETKLKRLHIPLNAGENEARGFIFHSDDAFECDRLMIIIHGSGVVRAGQWARRLIINHSLESGTQLPYIHKAKELGYGVLVLNSNQNYDEETHGRIRGSGSPEGHFNYVWSEIVRKRCKATDVAIVAHSYGGHITVQGAINNDDVLDKTFAVALTDSVHYQSHSSSRFEEWMDKHVCNWVSSGQPLDTPLSSRAGNCIRVSAGTLVHEETSWKAFDSVWKFFEQQWKERKATKNLMNSETKPAKGAAMADESAKKEYSNDVEKGTGEEKHKEL